MHMRKFTLLYTSEHITFIYTDSFLFNNISFINYNKEILMKQRTKNQNLNTNSSIKITTLLKNYSRKKPNRDINKKTSCLKTSSKNKKNKCKYFI